MPLSSIFKPSSIALIGATDRELSVGAGIMKNLESFPGKVYPVNPNQKEVCGKKSYPNIKNIEAEIDLAIIAVPRKAVLEAIHDCIEKKVGGIIIISAGFAESNRAGKKLQQNIRQLLKEAEIPLVGPNSLGVINPPRQLNASFAPETPPAGNIAFISQSGALIDSLIDLSKSENYSFSGLVSCGNSADKGIIDFLKWFHKDKNTKVIALYIEGIKKGSEFVKIAKKINRKKPIVVLKGGKSKAGNKAVGSHTAALTSSYNVYQAAFAQAGINEAKELQDLFDKAKALAWQPKTENKIAVLANSGGCNILAVDECQKQEISLVEFSKETVEKLKLSSAISAASNLKNPLDLIGDAQAAAYKDALEALLSQEYIKGLVVMQTLQITTDSQKNAKMIVEARKKHPDKPIVCSFMGRENTQKGIDILEANQIPNYSTPERAVRAMKTLIK